MVSALMVLLVIALISWFELRPLKGKRRGKDISVYFLLMTAGAVLFTLELTQVDLPNPLKMTMSLFDPLSKAIFAMLS
ncbi:hypothetical protein [Paenibacillus glycinis]|uniref:Uncharacterized protein n=1 Tax=Paenibacillus glycinis TaxID=2697035 RepID=A0ABW9XYN7_9BACL|nr:hypothetical protein [Paenibacillus glycinis]NBD27739.1 hypothetical protein [Paenibacillus glycinis]